MLTAFITPDDPRWLQILDQTRHDFYHLPEYVTFVSQHEGKTPLAFYAELDRARFLAPIWILDLPPALEADAGWHDVITPAGFTTPLLVPPDDSIALERFLVGFRDFGASQGIISAFFRLHPLLPLPLDGPMTGVDCVPHGEMVVADLSLPLKDLWMQTSRNHRQNIRRLVRAGFRAEMDRWEFKEAFIEIYIQNMHRCGASDYYFFNDEYFETLRSTLGDRIHLCTVISSEGELAAAGLLIVVDGLATMHLAGTGDRFVHYSPAKLMFDFARRWTKEHGYRIFNLGGGVTCTADSLFEFKAGFSRTWCRYYTLRMVIDETKYATLHARWAERGCQPDDESDFFPAYRRPIAAL